MDETKILLNHVKRIAAKAREKRRQDLENKIRSIQEEGRKGVVAAQAKLIQLKNGLVMEEKIKMKRAKI